MITKAKNLLLLGASSDQIFAIKTAKAMGHHVIVVDGNPKSPGFLMADQYAVVSTRDLPALKAFVDELNIPVHGVAVMGSDISQYVSALAEYLDGDSPAHAVRRLQQHDDPGLLRAGRADARRALHHLRLAPAPGQHACDAHLPLFHRLPVRAVCAAAGRPLAGGLRLARLSGPTECTPKDCMAARRQP